MKTLNARKLRAIDRRLGECDKMKRATKRKRRQQGCVVVAQKDGRVLNRKAQPVPKTAMEKALRAAAIRKAKQEENTLLDTGAITK